jgi:hypothetical protein
MADLTAGASSSTHRLRVRDVADAVATQLTRRRRPAVAQRSQVVAINLMAAGTCDSWLGGKERVSRFDQSLGHAARRLRSEADAPRGKDQTIPSTWNYPMMTQKTRKE